MAKEITLVSMEKGMQLLVSDKFLREKFAKIEATKERDAFLRAWEFFISGRALGETIESIEVPVNWRRLLKRKDCPKYMKKIKTIHVQVFYPKISLPEENHWVTFSAKS